MSYVLIKITALYAASFIKWGVFSYYDSFFQLFKLDCIKKKSHFFSIIDINLSNNENFALFLKYVMWL